MRSGTSEFIEALLNADPRTMTGGELTEWVTAMDQLRSLTEACYLVGVGEWNARGVWAEEGARSAPAWLSRNCDQRRGTAIGAVRDAVKLRDLPLSAAACDRLGTAKVRTMLRFVTDRTRAAYVEQEAFLLREAQPLTVDETARMMEFWALFADPDGADPGDPTRNEVHLSKTLDGRWLLSGNLDAVLGAQLRNALEWRADQLYRHYRATDDGLERSHAHLMAEALAVLLMDAGRGASRDGFPEQPSIGITVDITLIDDLIHQRTQTTAATDDPDHADDGDGDGDGVESDDAGAPEPTGDKGRVEHRDDIDDDTASDVHTDPGPETGFDPRVRCHIDGVDPIRGDTARRLACEAGIHRIITDGPSIILDAGRTIRTASPGQRRAMGARSPTCEFPGCDIPYRWTRAHHLNWWVRDNGRTDIDDLANVCDRDHHRIHEGGWTMRRLASGAIEVHRPDGTLFTPERDAARDVA